MTKRQEFLRWSGAVIVPMILWGFYILLLCVKLNYVNCSDCGGLFVIDCVIERWWKTTQNNFESYQKTVSQWFTDGLTKYLEQGGVSNWVIVAVVLAVYTCLSFFLQNVFRRAVDLVLYTGLHARTSRWMLCVWITCWANLISQIQSVSLLILMAGIGMTMVCWVGSLYNFDSSGLIEGTFAAFVGSELSFWGQNKFLQWLICVLATFFIFLFGLTDPPHTHENGSNDQAANQHAQPTPTQLLEHENEHERSSSEHDESHSEQEYEDAHHESHSENEDEHHESHSENEDELHESHSENEDEHHESHSEQEDEHEEAHLELEIRVDRHDGTFEYYYFFYAAVHDDGSFYYSWLSREGAHYFYGRLTRDRRQYYYGHLTSDGMPYLWMIDCRAHYYRSRVISNGIQYHYVRLYRIIQPQRNLGGNADHTRRSQGRKRKRVNADAADDTEFGFVSRQNKQFRATMN